MRRVNAYVSSRMYSTCAPPIRGHKKDKGGVDSQVLGITAMFIAIVQMIEKVIQAGQNRGEAWHLKGVMLIHSWPH